MDDGFLRDFEERAARRAVWRIRREAIEAELAVRRGVPNPVSTVVRAAMRAFRASALHGYFAARAVALDLTRLTFIFPDLPAAFDGYRILHLTDLHVDHLDGTAEATAAAIAGTEADLCVLTGDIRDSVHAPVAPVVERVGYVLGHVRAIDGMIGILGNHDSAAMVDPLEALGVRMLCNEVVHLTRGGQQIHVTGLDDVHKFHTEAAHVTLDTAPDGFGIALVHSPEIADRAAARHNLYLTGHTHGGQICLPGGRPLITGLKRHRELVSGLWRHGDMLGYTNRGTGATVLPLRVNCPGEVALITLKRGPGPAAC
ncbi:MAG: metallophosphoesterase [Alphaproteobacteria bacterium]|nr:metallophosphoesterase [Alphaproteobacteria bacterium]